MLKLKTKVPTILVHGKTEWYRVKQSKIWCRTGLLIIIIMLIMISHSKLVCVAMNIGMGYAIQACMGAQ